MIHSKSQGLTGPEQNLVFKHGCDYKVIRRFHIYIWFPFFFKKIGIMGKSGQPGSDMFTHWDRILAVL